MPKISCRCDPELNRAIDEFADSSGLTRSQAIRELLRQVVGYADPVDRGWREGYTAGMADAAESFQRAAAESRDGR